MNVTRRDDTILQIRLIRSGIFFAVTGTVFATVGSYVISESGPIVGRLIAGGIPLIAGGLMLVYGVLTCFTVWTFDRTSGTITHHQIKLTGGVVEEYSLEDVVGTRIDISSSSEGETYRLELVMAEGEVIPVTPFYSGGRRSLEKVAVIIGEFLGLSELRRLS